jgi:hypothetical protein
LHPPSQFSYFYVPNSNLLATITTSFPLLTDHSALITSTNTYEPNRDVLDTKQNKKPKTVAKTVAKNAPFCRISAELNGRQRKKVIEPVGLKSLLIIRFY